MAPFWTYIYEVCTNNKPYKSVFICVHLWKKVDREDIRRNALSLLCHSPLTPTLSLGRGAELLQADRGQMTAPTISADPRSSRLTAMKKSPAS